MKRNGHSPSPQAAPASPAAPHQPTGRAWLWRGIALCVLAVGLIAAWWGLRGSGPAVNPVVPPMAHSAAPTPPAAYVDNQQCLGCHAEQGQQWLGSHHAKAMAPATAQTVLGKFDNTLFKHQGITSRFFQRDGKFWVRTDGPKDGPQGQLADFEIAYTFGVAPLQQYLIAQPGGRLQPLQIAWDDERKRWFHLLPNEKAPAGDVLHWTGRYQTANTMCIACHTTGFEKRFDAASDSFASRWKEVNVSCQACHGPGERHVQWAQRKSEGRASPDVAGEHHGLTATLTSASAKEQVEVCAACHSRRSELSATPVPGQPHLDHYLPAGLTEGLYHADGQQLDEVFVDGSYRQSKMYSKGVSCTACHNAHTGKLKLTGNAVCTQCHTPQANAAFPSAAGPFDAATHHFHKEGSAGAQCVACHMPAKTYMQIQPRPDHSLRVPRPDLSVKLGTPNACNTCHTKQSAQWAADRVAAWYGPTRRQEPHYGEVFAAARAGQPSAGPALAALAGDTQQPAIVRTTALSHLGGDSQTGLTERMSATRERDPALRAAGADSLADAPPEQRLYALGPLLRDPILAVRMAAARSLSALPRERIGTALLPAFDAALAEYIQAQTLSLDMPGSHLNLAVVYANTGRPALAEKHYLDALKLDPDFTPARANLARLYNASGRNDEAEQVLKAGLARQPGIGELQYSLGLLLAEGKRLPEAAVALAKAAQLMPQRSRVHYNLGLTLMQLGQGAQAAIALERAHRLQTQDPAPPQALAMLFAQSGQREKALAWAETWAAAAPADPQPQRMILQLRGVPAASSKMKTTGTGPR